MRHYNVVRGGNHHNNISDFLCLFEIVLKQKLR